MGNDIDNKRFAGKVERLSTKVSNLSEVKGTLDEAINSKDMYYYEAFNGTNIVSGGTSTWDATNNRYQIQFFNTDAAGGTITHETRHGVGFFSGEFSFRTDQATGKTVPFNYDYQDEYEGYKLGSFANKYLNTGGFKYMTDQALKRAVVNGYKNNPYIIKSFNQLKSFNHNK